MQNFISLWYTMRVLLAVSANFPENPQILWVSKCHSLFYVTVEDSTFKHINYLSSDNKGSSLHQQHYGHFIKIHKLFDIYNVRRCARDKHVHVCTCEKKNKGPKGPPEYNVPPL